MIQLRLAPFQGDLWETLSPGLKPRAESSCPLDLPERGTTNFKAPDQASGLTSVIQVALSDLAAVKTPGVLAATSLCEEIVNEFVRATANTDESAHNRQSGFAGYRFATMRRAEEFLREHMDTPFSSRGLCSATRMSERSIEMLFKDAYGISPRAWSQIVRLNAARHDLLEGQSEDVRVSDVAVRWGFFHFGRFSAAYRQLFGELPSITAGQRRRCAVSFSSPDRVTSRAAMTDRAGAST
jgi:transcriptional regulator GlxA family with amidase domain